MLQAVDNSERTLALPWPLLSVERRYERYAAWCALLGVRAAPFDHWREKIESWSQEELEA